MMPKYDITFEVVSNQTFVMSIDAKDQQEAEDKGYDKFTHEFDNGNPIPWLKEVNSITVDLISVTPST
jgi:hypothetical protein